MWDGRELRATDPIPLLRDLVRRMEQRVNVAIAEWPPSEQGALVKEAGNAVANCTTAAAYESAITKLSALKERVHVELRRRQQVDEQTRQELEAEVSQIDSQGELPAGFKEKRLLLSDGNVGESLRQARELRRQIEEWKLEFDQRKKDWTRYVRNWTKSAHI